MVEQHGTLEPSKANQSPKHCKDSLHNTVDVFSDSDPRREDGSETRLNCFVRCFLADLGFERWGFWPFSRLPERVRENAISDSDPRRKDGSETCLNVCVRSFCDDRGFLEQLWRPFSRD